MTHGNELLQKKSRKIKKIFNILNQTNAIVANSNYTLSLVKKVRDSTDLLVLSLYDSSGSLKNIEFKGELMDLAHEQLLPYGISDNILLSPSGGHHVVLSGV